MEERQKRYLDKVVEFLVRDTEVDRFNMAWYPPFPSPYSWRVFSVSYLSSFYLGLFEDNLFGYCRDLYGITKDEVEYVWLHYKEELKDKINGYNKS